MLIQTTAEILDFEGGTIANGPNRNLQFRDIAGIALNNPLPNEQPDPLARTDIVRVLHLLFSGPAVEFEIEDLGLIKTRAGTSPHISPWWYGEVCRIIKNAEQIAPNAESNGAGELEPKDLVEVD